MNEQALEKVSKPKNKGKKNKQVYLSPDMVGEIFFSASQLETTQIMKTHISNLDFRAKPLLKQYIEKVMNEKYSLIEPKQLLPIIAADFQKINASAKTLQLSSPLADLFIEAFIFKFKQMVKNSLCEPTDFLSLWEDLPFRNLHSFLQQLQLLEEFRSLPHEKVIPILINLLTLHKLQQVCSYYLLYDRSLQEFEEEFLIPKIITTDQLYSSMVLQVLKRYPNIKSKVTQEIDKSKAVTIYEQLGQDPRENPILNEFILRKHYLSMTHEYQQWYVFEDKMCFNPLFIKWYCKDTELSQDILQSILMRNGLIPEVPDYKLVPNPLFEEDKFTATDIILSSVLSGHKEIEANYLLLQDFHITETDIHFIDDSSSDAFKFMEEDLMTSEHIGFDAQNRCTSTKYEQQGVSLIQLSTKKRCYIIDFLKFESDPKFWLFFQEFLKDRSIKKIGHTIQSDIKYLRKTSKIEQIEGFVDIVKLFKEKFPNQIQNSLAFMTHTLIGKKISKFEQRSNWNRRPLKKSQLHYASLDAFICLQLFDLLMNKQTPELMENSQKKQQKGGQKIIRLENIAYDEKYRQLLEQKKPKFLVDNMLKKLCSLMRNLGIDTQYLSTSDHEAIKDLADREGRIILTRDTKLLKRRDPKSPVYCISEKSDADLMFQEIQHQFKIDLNLFTPLSRCVKCNGDYLQIIPEEEAMKSLKFEYEDSRIKEFWRCRKCKQIYWEGKQWKKALDQFTVMKKK